MVKMDMQDLISKQMAMDALEQGFKDITNGIDELSPTYGLTKAVTGIYKCYIGKLQSIQPEIIYCKDCKQFRRWIDTDICFCDITETEMSDNDFCSKAERREVTE